MGRANRNGTGSGERMESIKSRDVTTFTVETFPYEFIKTISNIKRGQKNHGGKHRIIRNITCAFDIETTGLDDIEQSFMYIWMFAVGEDKMCIGRTWDEFKEFTFRLSQQINSKETLPVYVHNLSYEFQFLKGVYQFEPEEVFAIDKRKVLKCSMYSHKIEFRCSYIQTNMSLAMFTKKMGVKNEKLSGAEFDYKKKRYPWTELTDEEMAYCTNDVIGLVQAINKEMENDGDTLDTIPMTSTGYVRRDTKSAMRGYYRPKLTEALPNYETYTMLSDAFRGGNCHANRYYADQIIHNVVSYDRASSYPDVICNCEYPMKRFKFFAHPTVEWVEKLIYEYHRALLMRVELTNLSLRDGFWGAPYIARHKCDVIVGGAFDNGRVLKAQRLITTITDIDFAILLEEYNFGLNILELRKARYGKLPQQIIDVNIEYFKRKTELKGVEGQENFYMKSKNKLNSVYGMFAQSPVKQNLEFVNNTIVECEEDEKELLEKANKKAFLNYAWGIWVTAWARYRLEEGIRLAGDRFIYADTDSVKFIESRDVTTRFEEYNQKRIADSKQSGAFATDINGNIQYMGVYEHDADYDEFITMGAKKYAYSKNGKINLTVSGVNKMKGGQELEEHGGLGAFKEGFIFHKAGGTESVYNDEVDLILEIDGHELHITSNIYIKDSTYTLGLTAEYFNLIYKSKQLRVH